MNDKASQSKSEFGLEAKTGPLNVVVSSTGDRVKLVRSILYLGGGETLSRLIAFIGAAYLARTLEPEGFGMIGFAAAIFGYFQICVTAGFHDVGAREVARRPQSATVIAASVIVVRLALSAAALASLALLAWSLDKQNVVKLIVILTGLSFFSLAIDTSWVYKGLERSRPAALALIFGQTLYVGALWLVVRGSTDVTRVPLAQFSGEMGAALLLAIPLFRKGGIKPSWREGWEIFRGSWSLALTRLLRTVIFTFDVVLLGLLLGERSVGLYTAPYRICFLLLSIATVIQISYLPSISSGATQNSQSVAKATSQSIYLATAVAAPTVVGGIVLARPLLETLFGPNYGEGAIAFRLLLVSIACIFIYGAIHNVLLAYDRLRTGLLIMTFSAGLNIALALVAIPRYGLVGAAAVTAVSEIVILTLGLIAIHRLGVAPDLRQLWRPLVAATAMGTGLIALGPARQPALHLAVAIVIYAPALALLRGIPFEATLLWPSLDSWSTNPRRSIGNTNE